METDKKKNTSKYSKVFYQVGADENPSKSGEEKNEFLASPSNARK